MNDFAVVDDGGLQSIPVLGCLLLPLPLLRHRVLMTRRNPSAFLRSSRRGRRNHEVYSIDHTIGNLQKKKNRFNSSFQVIRLQSCEAFRLMIMHQYTNKQVKHFLVVFILMVKKGWRLTVTSRASHHSSFSRCPLRVDLQIGRTGLAGQACLPVRAKSGSADVGLAAAGAGEGALVIVEAMV